MPGRGLAPCGGRPTFGSVRARDKKSRRSLRPHRGTQGVVLFGSVGYTLSQSEDGVIDSVGLPFPPGSLRPDHGSDSLARLSTVLGE